MAYLTSGNIKINLKKGINDSKAHPIQLAHPSELKIEQNINEHASLYAKVKIGYEKSNLSNGNFDERVKWVELMDYQVAVEVLSVALSGTSGGTNNEKPLFRGIATKVEVREEKQEYYLIIHALSTTYLMDREEQKRSFQNMNMTVQSLLNCIYKDKYDKNENYKVTLEEGVDNKLGGFFLQYEETDWEFIRRVASNIGRSIVVADAVSEKPRFWFGIEKEQNDALGSADNLARIKQHVSSNLVQYRKPQDGVSYKHLETHQQFKIGDLVKIDNENWVITQVISQLEKEKLVHHHLFWPEAKVKRGKQLNDHLVGISLKAQVLAVKSDRLKLHLSFDEGNGEKKDCFFPYATPYSAEGHTGLYCMPEVNDYVYLYFGNGDEREGVVSVSIRSSAQGQLSNPQHKYFRTKHAKELKFTPEEIMITSQNEAQNKVLIWLNEKKGIVAFGQKSVRFHSKVSTSLKADKSIIVQAGAQLNVECKDSLLKLGDEMLVEGTDIFKV